MCLVSFWLGFCTVLRTEGFDFDFWFSKPYKNQNELLSENSLPSYYLKISRVQQMLGPRRDYICRWVIPAGIIPTHMYTGVCSLPGHGTHPGTQGMMAREGIRSG